jgi:hypothetical protein
MKFRDVMSSRVVLFVVVFAGSVLHLQAQISSALPQAQVGVAYTFELKVNGGKPPLKWSLIQGALPPGLGLSDSGIVQGTPSAATQPPLAFTVKVSDASNPSQEKTMDFSLSVTDRDGGLNPATFIKIYEDPKSGKRQLVYDPSKAGLERHLQSTADEGSTIIILPEAKLMGSDVPLNKLYITAKLASGDTSKDVPVIGYSEIGKDKATMASQTAAAFESASNIKNKILNMSFDATDILVHGYACPPSAAATPTPAATPSPSPATALTMTLADWKQKERNIDLNSDCVHNIDAKIAEAASNTDPNAHVLRDTPAIQPLIQRLNFYKPEIQKISGFFSDPQNMNIVEKIGAQIFWIDRDTLEGIAQQYQTDAQALSDFTNSEQKRAQALQSLVERTKLIYQDFGDLRQEVLSKISAPVGPCCSKEEWKALYDKATEAVGEERQQQAFDELKRLLAPGTISLVENKAKDGDRLTITVETVPAGGVSGGIPAVFEITVKKYGVKVGLGSSLLFIRRLGVTDAEATPPTGSASAPINRVNFAPSPGVTFGIAYFKRGNTAANKFFRGLAPGMGINVSFMNFNDPSFDLGTNKFVNTNGTNVQVGSGFIGSIFDNKLQLTYGWNLNVEQRRNYFGVGFDFIKAGEEIAKFFK